MSSEIDMRDLVGTHLFHAYWWGTRAMFSRQLGISDDDARRDSSRMVLMRIDDGLVVFDEQSISTSDHRDRSTWCRVSRLEPRPNTADFRWYTELDEPLVAEFRIHDNGGDELIYATRETDGLCFFEVGNRYDEVYHAGQWSHSEFYFSWEVDLNGYTPTWLEPDDDAPPVEIAPKKKHGDRILAKGSFGRSRRDMHASYEAQSRMSAQRRGWRR